MSSYANLDSREGSVSTQDTITFNWKPRKIIVTNDSTTKDLKIKFNASETYMTLHPTESFSGEIASKTIILQSEDQLAYVKYRIWGFG